jgi:hypothetical protein
MLELEKPQLEIKTERLTWNGIVFEILSRPVDQRLSGDL